MWYVGAFCRRAQGWRTFKLSRIESVEETGERFDRNGRGTFDLHGLDGVDRAPRAVLAVHDPSAVRGAYVWRGLERVDRPAAEDEGHLSDSDRRRGGFVASIPWVDDSPWLARMVAATFGDVEVLRPEALRAQVRDLAAGLRSRVR